MNEISELAKRILKGDHSCLHITFNDEHGVNYMSAKDYYAQWPDDDDDWVSEEEREKAIRENSVWSIQWYPNSPVGFCRLRASTLEALLDAMRDIE